MERQRSFSLKPTRLLLISFTLSSSLVFLIVIYIWAIKGSPSLHLETHFQLNEPSLGVALKPLVLQSLTGTGSNFSAREMRNSIQTYTQFRSPQNTSEIGTISGFEEVEIEGGGNELSEDERVIGKDVNDNLTTSANFPANDDGGKNTSLIESRFVNSDNASGFAEDSISRGIQRRVNMSKWSDDGAVNGNLIARQQNVSGYSSEKLEISPSERDEKRGERICDVTKGSWVFDESYPLYANGSCPFIDEGFNCEDNGRLDKDYMKLRWQPQDCAIPRFNAAKMLETIRGKRLVFVGDSINRNQWESMLCLLVGAVKNPKRVYETHGRRITKEKGNYSFKFVDYQCTVEYYVTHFLVHESKARVGKRRVQTLRIDTIDKGSSRWRGADILVFNTAHWWAHYKTKAGVNYYQEGNLLHPRLDVSTAFRKALLTWASWIDKHINPSKTQVFFRSSSPSHFRGGQWNSGGHCKEATWPLNETFNTYYPEKNIIVEAVIRRMRTPVIYLNVTRLSGYRIDGHPSVFGRKPGNSYAGIQDCSHWCLPGVPDAWNEMLYFHLQHKTSKSFAE